MNSQPQDSNRAQRDMKAAILGNIRAPYLPLLTFLREAPSEEIRRWTSAAPEYDPAFWNVQDGEDIRCLSYAFNSVRRRVNPGDLELKRLWDTSAEPGEAFAVINRYIDFQRNIETSFVVPFLSAAMPQAWWTESKILDMRTTLREFLSYNLKLLEKPEDLDPGHYPVGLGFDTRKYVLRGQSAFHLARMDRDGTWSEKQGPLPVRSSHSSDPLSLTSWSAPTCFFQLPAHNKP